MNGDTIVSIIIGTVFVLMLLGAFWGLIRKWKKALLRFGIVVIDLVATVFAANRAVRIISPENAELSGNPELIELFTNVPSLLTLTGGLLKPLIFMGCCIASSLFSLLIYWIISLFIRYKEKENTYPMAGMLIGAVQGLVVALVLVAPIIGYASLADQAVASYKDVVGEEVPGEIAEVHATYIEPINQHPLVKVIGTFSSPIFETLVTFDLGEDTFNPSEEIPVLLATYHNVTLLMDAPIEEYDADQKAAINNLATLFGQSAVLPNVGADFLSAIGTKWQAGESFMGIDPITVDSELTPIIDALYAVFATTTVETLKTDIVTIGDFVILMVDYNVTSLFDGGDDVLALVTEVNPTTNKTFIKAATELLDSNPHMAILRAGITKLGANLLGSQLGSSEEIRENYGDMVTGVVDVLKNLEGDTNEEKIEALTPTIKEELAKNDIDLPEEIVDEASKFLLEELEKEDISIEDMTEEDIYNILDKIAAGEITIPIP